MDSEEPADHRSCVMIVAMAARALDGQPIEKAIEQAQRSLDVGAPFHPTAWIEKHKALEEDLALLRAALPLVRLVKKLRAAGKAE
jgi:hypothetical protein